MEDSEFFYLGYVGNGFLIEVIGLNLISELLILKKSIGGLPWWRSG